MDGNRDREALAIYGLKKLVVDYSSKLFGLLDRGASAPALAIAVGNFEANCGTEVTFEGLVEWGRGVRCHDCDVDLMPHDPDGWPVEGWERYMVHDEVWKTAGGEGWLCIGCLEQRLDRPLEPRDFKSSLTINEPSPLDSARIRDRREATS
jgi:hypothetical protein